MSLAAIVPQRTYSDCGVAALATLQGWTYEKARTVLGAHVTDVGACLLPMVAPLLEEGIAGTYFMARDHPGLSPAAADQQAVRHLSTASEMRRLLVGRRAIVGVQPTLLNGQPIPGRGHALAWDGARAIECGSTAEGWARPASEISLDAYPIREALILSEIAPSDQPSPNEIPVNDESDQRLAALLNRHERVFLAFSGGKESVTLAHMLEPWRERVTLLWVNTGHMAPHMVEFVRSYGSRFDLQEIASPDLAEHWQAMGTPAEVFPIGNLDGATLPRLQPWLNCCHALRTEPMNAVLREQSGPCAFIAGQRQQDERGATVRGLRSRLPGTVEVVMPLASWSEADVFAYVERHGLTLPPQYAQGYADSIECLPCPAPMKAARLRYLRKHYPAEASMVGAASKAATDAVLAAALQIITTTQSQEAL